MSVRDYLTRVCIHLNGKIYKLFAIGYHRDGGYFIEDFLDKWSVYLASKIHYRPVIKRDAHFIIPVDKKNSLSVKIGKPKISCHFDGNFQISWDRVRSGYNNGEPKWLATKGSSLDYGNDGGPMFCFSFGLNLVKSLKYEKVEELNENFLKKRHLVLNDEILVREEPRIKSEDTDHLYTLLVIEGYYINKASLPDDMNSGKLFVKDHPTYGAIPLVPLPSPIECPYIFGIASITRLRGDPDFFSYAGAAWLIQEDWSWDVLSLVVVPKGVSDNFDDLESLDFIP